MTAWTEAAAARPPVDRARPWPTAPLVLAATTLSLAIAAPAITFVLRGGFSDPDDAMRLVEVRDWMGGRAWFDVAAPRLDPPLGAAMHWSRLVDLPNAALIRLFGLFVDRPLAEALDRIVLPTLLLVALYAAMARLGTLLLGAGGRLPALLGTLLSGATLVQFMPGRIGHHGPAALMLVLALTAALAALDPRQARWMAVAGALVALSLGVSLETLPLLVGLCGALVVAWVVSGAPMASALIWFAGGLAGLLPLVFLVTVPMDAWFAATCDALGMAHLGVGLVGAAGIFALARGSWALRTWTMRLAAAGVCALAVLFYLCFAYPACLGSPFAGVDPLVRAVWLDHVVESKPFLTFLRERPATGVAVALPVVLGFVGCLAAALVLRGVAATRFAVLAGLTALGLGLGLWQVRAFTTVTPLALCGGVFAAVRLRQRLEARHLRLLAAAAPVAIVPFTSFAWALALPAPAGRGDSACLSPAALAPLADLPAGRVVAPIDVGSHLLAATSHTVFAAPYHRNNDGNRFAIDVFLAPPARAASLLAARRVDYVMICDGMGETARLAAQAPGGLAARLLTGRLPADVRAVPLVGTPYRVFAVRAGPAP